MSHTWRYTITAHHPPDSFFKTLDSSVKKNSLFVKKLSSLTESSRTKLVQDLKSLNLNKYIEEVVNAICGAKLKVCRYGMLVCTYGLRHGMYSRYEHILYLS